MFLGHQGIALAAKAVAPRAQLGVLTFAANWLDLLWPFLLLTGLELVEIAPGHTVVTPLNFVFYPYSHSLLFATGWGILMGALYGWRAKDRTAAAIVGLLVISHWVIDLIVHRPDLPLYPGGAGHGLGLWNSISATLAAELILFIPGVVVYARVTRPRDRVGHWSLVVFVAFLLAVYALNLIGPPPPDWHSVAWVAFALWLIPLWAGSIDSHRGPVG